MPSISRGYFDKGNLAVIGDATSAVRKIAR